MDWRVSYPNVICTPIAYLRLVRHFHDFIYLCHSLLYLTMLHVFEIGMVKFNLGGGGVIKRYSRHRHHYVESECKNRSLIFVPEPVLV